MSILEDLDLMELLDELPTGTDFDLDDILSEFSTPGLFEAPKKEEPSAPVTEAKGIAEAMVEEVREEIAEEPMGETAVPTEPAEEEFPVISVEHPAEAVVEEAAPVSEIEDPVPVIADDTDDDLSVVPDLLMEAEPETDYAHNDNTLFGDSLGLCDILFECSAPTEETAEAEETDEAAVSQPQAEDEEDDVKIYVPETAAVPAEPKHEVPQTTVLFDTADLIEETKSVPTDNKPAAQPKAPGFFAKAVAAIMGLFGSKKADAAEAQSVEEEPVTLFVPKGSAENEAVPVIALSEELAEEAVSTEPDAVMSEADLLLLFADEDLSDDTAPANEPADDVLTVEEPTAEEPVQEELVEEAEEPLAAERVEEELAAAAEEEEIGVEEDVLVYETALSSEVEECEASEGFEDPEAIAEPEEIAAEDAPLEEAFSIHDILFELSDFAEEEEDPQTAVPAVFDEIIIPEDDMKVYAPEEIPAASTAEEQSEPTIVFDAIDLSAEAAPVEVPPTAENQKAPGFLAKAAGLVAGLFASKKAAKAVTPAPHSVPAKTSEGDPFADMAALFNDTAPDDLSGLDDLMLELELQAEREAELKAEAAAREAEERLAREEQQRLLELEAQRLAQAEADAEAEALRAEAAAARSAFETAVVLEEPTLEEPAFQAESPVYDFTAVDLSAQEQDYTAPQMNINIDEEVPEEVGDLLEMPDTEQLTADEETPEEAAARKKKEDDSLHYTPEESPAKVVSSHIRNRFGAAFAAFTQSSEDYDDEDTLGPELPASKAYRFFNKYINGYRFRLRVSTILCVILGWISLGLPVLGSLKNPAVAAAMCLMLLLTVMLAGADILAVGVRNLLSKRPSIHSLVALSCFASVVDAIVIILTKGAAGYLPFCSVSAISMCFAIYGSLLYCRSQRLNFKTLDRATEPMTISVDYGIVEEDTSTVYRTPGHPEGYIHHSEEEDLSETVFGILAPILIPTIPVLTLIAALFSGGFGDFFHIMAAMFAAAASFGALIAFPLPYFLVQKELYATKAAIAGWAGVRELGRVSNMIVSDRDLFPDETVSIKSVRIVDNVPPQLTLSYMCSVIAHSESCLVPAFTQLAENNDCELLEVENFQCHEAGGLSAEIGPDSVLVASHSYMKLQGFRIPARKKDSENALFLAVNGHVIAYIIVDYKPIKSVRAGLQSALRGNVEMIFAARDFNVTPLLISKKFKSTTETLRFPSYSQRYEITSQVNSETAACAAVVYRKSFYSYAVVVEKARYLYNSVSWGVILATGSSIMGVLFMFVMALTGGGTAITVGRLLVFMLLWLLPTLALTVSITK